MDSYWSNIQQIRGEVQQAGSEVQHPSTDHGNGLSTSEVSLTTAVAPTEISLSSNSSVRSHVSPSSLDNIATVTTSVDVEQYDHSAINRNQSLSRPRRSLRVRLASVSNSMPSLRVQEQSTSNAEQYREFGTHTAESHEYGDESPRSTSISRFSLTSSTATMVWRPTLSNFQQGILDYSVNQELQSVTEIPETPNVRLSDGVRSTSECDELHEGTPDTAHSRVQESQEDAERPSRAATENGGTGIHSERVESSNNAEQRQTHQTQAPALHCQIDRNIFKRLKSLYLILMVTIEIFVVIFMFNAVCDDDSMNNCFIAFEIVFVTTVISLLMLVVFWEYKARQRKQPYWQTRRTA